MIETLENQVRALPAHELARFRNWFMNFDWSQWDGQIERDAAAGRLDAIANAALDDHRMGRSRQV